MGKQEKECTFAPTINKSHLYLNQMANQQIMSQHTQSQGQSTATVSMKKRRLMQQIKEKQDEEFRKHCTFKPKLCKASARIAKQRKENRHFKASTRVKIHADDDEMKECAFHPEINASANLRLKHVQEYVAEYAYKRLSTTVSLGVAQNECADPSKSKSEKMVNRSTHSQKPSMSSSKNRRNHLKSTNARKKTRAMMM